MEIAADRSELKKLQEKILPVLEPSQVKRVAIFGSVIRGEDTPGSDLDILVSLPPPGERLVIGLKWFDLVEQLIHYSYLSASTGRIRVARQAG